MKNLIFLSKAFVTIVAMLSIGLSAFAYSFEAGGIYYNITNSTNKTVEVTSGTEVYSGSVSIPSSVTYSGTTYSVTKIGSGAFEDCTGLTSVTIPNSVTEISGYAFSGCKGLTSITIPNSVTSIGSGAFYNCSGLTNLIIEDGRNSLYLGMRNDSGLGLFYDCPLKSAYLGRNIFPSDGLGGPFNLINNVTIGNSVTEIYRDTFCGCSGLTTVSIGNSVISIGYSAFSGCTSLTSITIPNSVTKIGESAFEGCSGLTSVTIPNSVTKIGLNAFNGCSGLTSVTIPNSVTTIASYAFGGCKGLTSVTIPNSVIYIRSYAFYDCSGLTSVTIPNSVTSIGNEAFMYCGGLTEVNISDLSAWCKIDFKDVLANPLFYAHKLKLNGTEITELVNPDDISEINNYAFCGCTGLTSVTIPNSVTSIGDYAFWGCSGLTELIIEDGTESLSLGYNDDYEGLFYDCPIENLYLGRNLSYDTSHKYGYSPFYNCDELTSVTIGNSVTTIGERAFLCCNGLTSITIPNSVTKIGDSAFNDCSELTSVTIPNFVTEIGNRAFEGCSGLTSVTIPNSVTTIGSYAFNGCTGLTSVTIPNSVTSIGSSAFGWCSGLTEVTIPNSVTLIGSSAFYNCERLAEVNISDLSAWCKITFGDIDANPLWYAGHLYLNGTEIKDLVIPDDITLIKDLAFYGCFGLTSVTIPNSVTKIGNFAFSDCWGLAEVIIPNSVTEIGYSTFYGCGGLKEVTIPNSVTSIGNEAFRGCSGLTTVSIGNSATEIGDYAFRDCSGLKEIVSLNPEPPICNDDICFLNVPTDCILKVPAGAKEAYSAAVGWSQFTNIIEIATVEVSTQGDNATFEIPTAVDAVKYTVKVYSDAEMTQLIATANYDADGKIMPMSTSLELSIDGFADGTYYYSVSALSENGVELENHTGEFVINVATGIGNASIENKTTEVARYDIYGRLLSKPTKGVNIVKMSDGTTKKLIIKN